MTLLNLSQVISWLECNCRRVVARVDSKDPLVETCTEQRGRRYLGTPTNVYRHVVVSEFEHAVAVLPKVDWGISPLLSMCDVKCALCV